MNDDRDATATDLGSRWATINPRTAAVLRERRLQVAIDPATGRHRLTMS